MDMASKILARHIHIFYDDLPRSICNREQGVSILRRKKADEAYDAGTKQEKGQAQDFQTFYQENLGLVYRYVYSKVENREEAEDLTSQIFLKAVKGVQTERGSLSAQKWLFQVARTTIADHWRVHYRHVSTTSLEVLLEEGWEGPADTKQNTIETHPVDRVERLLLALPEQYREVLNCRFLLKLSIRETAVKLGLTEANVKVLQFRALKRASELEELVSEIM